MKFYWFVKWHVIVRIKFNCHVIFSIIIFFTTIYCFDFVFNSISNICVFLVVLFFFINRIIKNEVFISILCFIISTCMTNKQIQRLYTVNIFTIINYFNFDVSNVADINAFIMFFCLFLTSLSRSF